MYTYDKRYLAPRIYCWNLSVDAGCGWNKPSKWMIYVPRSKLLILGMGDLPPLIPGILISWGPINPYRLGLIFPIPYYMEMSWELIDPGTNVDKYTIRNWSLWLEESINKSSPRSGWYMMNTLKQSAFNKWHNPTLWLDFLVFWERLPPSGHQAWRDVKGNPRHQTLFFFLLFEDWWAQDGFWIISTSIFRIETFKTVKKDAWSSRSMFEIIQTRLFIVHVPLALNYQVTKNDTVDGWNLAPPGMYETL